MAVFIINRASSLGSRLVLFDLALDGKKVEKIADGGIVVLGSISPGVHSLKVSALYGIYCSRSIKVSVRSDEEVRHFLTGNNFFNASFLPLVILQGLLPFIAFYIREIAPESMSEKLFAPQPVPDTWVEAYPK